MNKHQQLLQRIVARQSDANIRFTELRLLLLALGFEERKRGSHHIFRKAGVEELVNLQSDSGHAKVYQVRQIRQLILKYELSAED